LRKVDSIYRKLAKKTKIYAGIPYLGRIIPKVKVIGDFVRKENELNEIRNDWKFIAAVLDRCFLWIFVILCIFGSCILVTLSFFIPVETNH